jgi:hypothetical protein
MLNRLTNFTPFFMVYGAEGVLPTELQYRSPRVRAIDLLEKLRDIAVTRSNGYQRDSDGITHAGFIPGLSS